MDVLKEQLLRFQFKEQRAGKLVHLTSQTVHWLEVDKSCLLQKPNAAIITVILGDNLGNESV